jgi:hypothetical protein
VFDNHQKGSTQQVDGTGHLEIGKGINNIDSPRYFEIWVYARRDIQPGYPQDIRLEKKLTTKGWVAYDNIRIPC